MDRFQLATIARWAGENGLQGRKRLQKVVYFLQSADCPLNAEFILHRYGPYSWDVANVCDQMATVRLLDEQQQPNAAGVQYRYTLPEHAAALLSESEQRNPQRAAELAPFEDLARDLLREELWTLELGSTILYFYRDCKDWIEAIKKACVFKKVPEDGESTMKAAALARRVGEYRARPVTQQ